jgi:HAD superfamily hydrolase (TIGR01509 family)
VNWQAGRGWIFDLDGTLTVAVHDFDAIRAELSLPRGRPILEALAALPEPEQRWRYARLDAIERELARLARPAPGAEALLDRLLARGARLGILTRNSHAIALDTLRVAGLERFFEPAHVLGRESARPKPEPDGVHLLLSAWSLAPSDAVVVGDYLFDLRAGRAAGTATIHVDVAGAFRWPDHADHCVRSLADLLP